MKFDVKNARYWLVAFGIAIGMATLALVLFAPTPTHHVATSKAPIAASFQGQVIRVADGDSITVRAGEANIAIRLAEIDAPERGQPWGTRAKQALSDQIAGKTVTVQPRGQDRYGRTIAIVWDRSRNINREMVAQGAAWAYRAYQTDASFSQLESQARASRTGLWAMDANQVIAPWDYRKAQRDRKLESVAR